jgi:hypothetical protein
LLIALRKKTFEIKFTSFYFFNTVKSEIKTNEPIKPPMIVNGGLDPSCVRNNCIDANNNKLIRSDIRNDEACDAAK